MIKVSVMYPNREGATFDMPYYLDRHMALVRELLGPAVKGIAVDEGVAANGAPPYVAIGHLLFENLDAFSTALANHGPALMADIPNYTNTQPTIQVSEIKL